MNTSRRTILGASAALALPTWMASAFAREQSAPASGTENALDQKAESVAPKLPTLDAAQDRARGVGKPVLVLVADPDAVAYTAGTAWGEFFALATKAVWLDLALVEIVCLPRAALGDLERAKDPKLLWAVLYETDDTKSPPRFVEGDLPATRWSSPDSEHAGQARARSAALASLVHAVVLPDADAPGRRTKQSLSSFEDFMALSEVHGQYEAAVEETSIVRLTDLDRFAAVVRFQDPPKRLEELALAARVRIFEHDPSGARWQTRSNFCPPCGMGFVYAESRYFLSFFAQ